MTQSSKQTVLLTGASSFLGAHTLLTLSKRFNVIGVYNKTPLTFSEAPSVQIDLTTEQSYNVLQSLNIDWVVHLAGKIQSTKQLTATQCNRKMLDAVLSLNKPIVYASSTAVHWDYDIPYVQIRREDEQRIVNSGLPYVIVRPCAPYGPKIKGYAPKHKESFQTLVDFVRRAPVVPIVGDGKYLRQPIHATDFANLIGHCILENETHIAFDAAGGTTHSFNEVVQILQAKVHRKRPLLHIPKKMAVLGSRLFGNLEPSLVRAMDSSETFDVQSIQERIQLKGFEEGCWDLLF
jgi:nucleoside-diphosphate-sugar epimerase